VRDVDVSTVVGEEAAAEPATEAHHEAVGELTAETRSSEDSYAGDDSEAGDEGEDAGEGASEGDDDGDEAGDEGEDAGEGASEGDDDDDEAGDEGEDAGAGASEVDDDDDEAGDEGEDEEAGDEDDDDEAGDEGEDEEAGDEEEPLGFGLPPAMSRMSFVDIVLVLPSTHPVVVLQEADMPYRELRIPIGGPEGIAIGYAARQVETPRPLTHELMTQLLERFNLSLDFVNITGLTGGMFTAELVVSGPAGQRTLDCRPSDAIALALRQRIAVPIMAAPDVLDRAAGAAAGSN
jgi:hypothetical protein